MGNVLDIEMDARRKLVLLVLADYAEDDGSKIFPSQPLIALRASISERKWRDHLHALEKKDWVKIIPGRGRSRVNNYQLNVDKIRLVAAKRKEQINIEKASRSQSAGAPNTAALRVASVQERWLPYTFLLLPQQRLGLPINDSVLVVAVI